MQSMSAVAATGAPLTLAPASAIYGAAQPTMQGALSYTMGQLGTTMQSAQAAIAAGGPQAAQLQAALGAAQTAIGQGGALMGSGLMGGGGGGGNATQILVTDATPIDPVTLASFNLGPLAASSGMAGTGGGGDILGGGGALGGPGIGIDAATLRQFGLGPDGRSLQPAGQSGDTAGGGSGTAGAGGGAGARGGAGGSTGSGPSGSNGAGSADTTAGGSTDAPGSASASDFQTGSIRKRIVEIASAEVGVKEEGGEDRGGRVSEYQKSVTGGYSPLPWCSFFTSWVFNQAGVPIVDDNGDGLCQNVGDWAKRAGRWHERGSTTPKPGDIVLFKGSRGTGRWTDHIGIVEKVENGRIHTIEGNSSDAVNRRSYDPGDDYIVGFVDAE